MTLGRKSTHVTIEVNNNTEKQFYTFQVNRHFGICDMEPRINNILSDFQGQQLVYKHGNTLYRDEDLVLDLQYAIAKELSKDEN